MLKEYEMTQEDLDAIRKAGNPVGGVSPPSPQESIDRAWAALGKRMGFDPASAGPSKRGHRFFYAEPIPTETTENI